MNETSAHAQNQSPPSRSEAGLFNTLVDESPVIALSCMLAICLGGIFFVIRRPDYATPALELLTLILLSKVSVKELLKTAGLGGDKTDSEKDIGSDN